VGKDWSTSGRRSTREEPVVITCAITGGASRLEGNPNLPYTPEEQAREARRAVDEGASIIHIHGRDPATGAPSHAVDHYAAALEAIRAEVPSALINLSTGGSAPIDERLRPVRSLRPDMATCALGSYIYAARQPNGRGLKADRAAATTFANIVTTLETLRDVGASPDLECYEFGHLDNLDVVTELGVEIPRGGLSFVLGVVGSLAADERNLRWLVERAGTGRHWTAIVIDPRRHWPLLATALDLGGGIRVGFEDCAWLDNDTMAASNGELVERAVQLVRDTGRDVADAAATRDLLMVPSCV
jgi:uncharacterized protein (DUF849 family)